MTIFDMQTRYKVKILTAIFLFAVVLFFPFDLTIAERREFQVVDKNGSPIKDAMVRQTWYQYSLDFREETTYYTNSDGFVLLPPKRIRTRIFDLIYGAVITIFEYKLHASIGSADAVSIHVEGYAWKSFQDGEGLESKTVVIK